MVEIWKQLCVDKQQRQNATIPTEWLVRPPSKDRLNVLDFPLETGLLSSLELDITGSNVEDLLNKLAFGTWTAVDVVRAFCKRAIIAHQAVNCLTEIFVDEALERAAKLDNYLKSKGEVIGPLHGLPISLKDQVSIKGLETTMGYASWIGKYATKDATLVEILYQQGAIPFVRTNVPQTLSWTDSYNYIFGRTLNPFNRSLSPGGSSGGEGALIGMRGSVLGVGSDIGGSIRIPALFQGLYGFRPSANRIPYRGVLNCLDGQDSIMSVLGPISTSLFGIKVFTKAVIDAQPWRKDPLATNKPWSQAAYELSEHGDGKSLTFGIIWDDGNVIPHPPIQRALKMARDSLVAAGHKVIDWKPYKHIELFKNFLSILTAGISDDFAAVTALTGEPIITTMDPSGHPPPSACKIPEASNTAFELWQAQKRRRELREEYVDHWEGTVAMTGTGRPVDAVISPATAFAPPPHGKNTSIVYTAVWNTLDYPALVFPVTKVDPKIDLARPPHEFLSEEDENTYKLYDPEVFSGAPVGLQVIARTGEDEALIAMAEIVDKALKTQG